MEKSEKLTYTKINNSDNVISIDLHNGFTIIAISGYQPEKSCFNTTLYIKENDIDIWNIIDEFDNLKFHANHKNINSAILKQVSEYFNQGLFDSYIDRYNFDMHCIDLGYKISDKAKLCNV